MNSWLILVALASWLCLPTSAEAGGRKRVVVLELEGPKAEKFHDDLVKLIKKTHTVIPIDKWNGTAEELDASSPNDKNIKKVAKKLKIDAIVQGKIEKRRDEYIIQLKLRAGKSGAVVGNRIDVKADGPRIDGSASGDLKDELIPAIDSVGSNRAGGGDDEAEEEEDKPAKKKPTKKDDEEVEEEEEKPAKKGFSKKKDEAEEEEEEKPAKKGFSRKKDDENAAALKTKKDKKDDEEEDDAPLPKPKKVAKKDDDESEEEEVKPKKKKVAKRDDGDDEEEGIEASSEDEGESVGGSEALRPGERAVDAVLGLSFNARRMSFTYSSDLGNNPKPYKGVPVAGVLIDATVYPLAIGHKRKGMLKNLGATVMYDRVIKINSKQGDTTLPTSQAHWAVGAVFRYPLGKLTVGASVRYGRQNFTIGSAGGVTSEMPNVNYTILDPGAFLRYELGSKIILNARFGYLAFLGTGAIQKNDQYGAATVTGFEGELGGDYLLTKNIFARASFKYETIGFKFKGTGSQSTMRDTDMEQDVFGARDNYIGGTVTVGYLY
ncbi:MAG: hypothetical protein H0T46_18480 [Deltaproteobacteria bacterium]|nr:hypothetical protein [Deltaproteobacteria bacterium]